MQSRASEWFDKFIDRKIIKRDQIKYYHIKSYVSMLGACSSGPTPPSTAEWRDAWSLELWPSCAVTSHSVQPRHLTEIQVASRVIQRTIGPASWISLKFHINPYTFTIERIWANPVPMYRRAAEGWALFILFSPLFISPHSILKVYAFISSTNSKIRE